MDRKIACRPLSPEEASEEFLRRLFMKPSFLLLGTSIPDKDHPVTLEQKLTRIAADRAVPVFSVLDFDAGYAQRFSSLDTPNSFSFLPDMLFVPSSYGKEEFLEEVGKKKPSRRPGLENKVVVTGNPYFDDFIALRDAWTSEKTINVRQSWGVGEKDYVVLFLSQPIRYHYEREDAPELSLGYTEADAFNQVIAGVEWVAEENPKMKFAVVYRTHPNKLDQGVIDIAGFFPGSDLKGPYPLRQDTNRNVWESILSADLVASPFATDLQLAKVGISVQPGLIEEKNRLPRSMRDRIIPAYAMGDFEGILRRLTADPDYTKEVSARPGMHLDGKSKVRVADGIENYLGRQKAKQSA